MTIKKSNKIVPITLTRFHLTKLNLLCNHTGLNKSNVIQRLLERHDTIFELKEVKEKK